MLDEAHWKVMNFRQRMTSTEWRKMLLNNDDTIIFQGRVYRLKAKNLGHGVVEVYKDKL